MKSFKRQVSLFILSIVGAFVTNTSLAQVPAITVKKAKCDFSFLRLNEDITGVKGGTVEFNMTPTESLPVQPQYSNFQSPELIWNSKKDRKLTLKTTLTYIENASLWPEAGQTADRLQIYIAIVDETGRIVANFRENTDRVVRQYQIDEILQNKLILRLALPMAVDQEKIYANPETSLIAETKGLTAARSRARFLGVLSGEEPIEMGVYCEMH